MGTIKTKKVAAKVAKVTKKAAAVKTAKPVKAAKKPAKNGGCKSCGK